MKLGSATSNSFLIGTSELRVGPLASAGKLSQAHSIGLVDSVTVTVGQKTVDLMGGFPQTTVASAVVEQTAQISGVLREYSRRNIGVMLGAGILAAATAVETTIAADLAANATTVTVASAAGLAVGDVVVIYQEGRPELVSVVKITAIATNDLTIAANTLANAYTAALGTIHLYKANQIAIGDVDQVHYFSASTVAIGASGKPEGFNFWKVSVGGDGVFQNNPKDFSSTTLNLKVSQPTFEDLDTGGSLNAIAGQATDHPLGLRY